MIFKYNVTNEINWMIESIHLVHKAVKYKGEFNAKDFSLVANTDNLIKSSLEIDEEFSDVYKFNIEVLKEALDLFADDSYWWVLSQDISYGYYEYSYLYRLLLATNAKTFNEVSYEDFMRINLLELTNLVNDEEVDKDRYKSLKDKKFGKSDWSANKLEIHVEDIFKILEGLSISNDKKLAILKIYSDSENVYKDFKEKLNKCEEIIRKNLYLVQDRIDKTYENLKKEQAQEEIETCFRMDIIEENFDDNLKKKLDLKRGFQLYVGPVGYNNGFTRIPEDKGKDLWIYVGLLTLKLLNYEKKTIYTKEKIIEETKAMGDNTRFEIISMLRERPYYLKELAEKIGSSPSTVSHHISILVDAGFINPTMKDRKMYYLLQKEKFKELGEYYINLAEK